MKKDILILGAVILLVILLAAGTDIQSVDEYYLTHIDDITEDSETVTLSINCSTVLDNWDRLPESLQDEAYVPSDGWIMKKTACDSIIWENTMNIK